MPAEVNSTETYDRVNNKESVTDRIKLFEREETPIYSSVKKVKAKNVYEEWLEDTLLAVGANTPVLQGDDIGGAQAQALPTRRGNHAQIFKDVYSASETANAASAYGYGKEINYARVKKMKEHKRKIEQAIVQNAPSIASTGGAGGQMAGLESIISSNASRGAGGAGTGWNNGTKVFAAPTDGTQRLLDENTIFNDVLRVAYDNGYPAKNGRMIMGNSTAVNRISSSFTGNQSRFSQDKNKVNNNIKYVQSTMGDEFVVMRNPRMRPRTVLIIDPSEIEIRVLRDIKVTELPKTTDGTREMIISEMTSICRERAQVVIADLNT